jgi:hypothetical protein
MVMAQRLPDVGEFPIPIAPNDAVAHAGPPCRKQPEP